MTKTNTSRKPYEGNVPKQRDFSQLQPRPSEKTHLRQDAYKGSTNKKPYQGSTNKQRDICQLGNANEQWDLGLSGRITNQQREISQLKPLTPENASPCQLAYKGYWISNILSSPRMFYSCSDSRACGCVERESQNAFT